MSWRDAPGPALVVVPADILSLQPSSFRTHAVAVVKSEGHPIPVPPSFISIICNALPTFRSPPFLSYLIQGTSIFDTSTPPDVVQRFIAPLRRIPGEEKHHPPRFSILIVAQRPSCARIFLFCVGKCTSDSHSPPILHPSLSSPAEAQLKVRITTGAATSSISSHSHPTHFSLKLSASYMVHSVG